MIKLKSYNQFLNEKYNSNVYYHITPASNLENIKKDGIKQSDDGTFGKGVYLSDSLYEAKKWKDVLEMEKYSKYGNQDWYIIEVNNLDENKIIKNDIYEEDELYFTEYVYRDDISKEHIKNIIKI